MGWARSRGGSGAAARRAHLAPRKPLLHLTAARAAHGEAAALRWPAHHLDDDVPTLDIVASLQRIDKTMRLTKPKTPSSVRTLGLPHAAVSASRQQKKLQELERGASSNPHFNPLQRAAAANLMSAAGMSLEDISDTLGHRSVMVTAEIYRHPIAAVRIAHVGAMDGLLAKEYLATEASHQLSQSDPQPRPDHIRRSR